MKKSVCVAFAFFMLISAAFAAEKKGPTVKSVLESPGLSLLGIKPPVPKLLFDDPAGDVFRFLPPQPPRTPGGGPVPQPPVVDLIQVSGRSNGLVTVLEFSFAPGTEMDRIMGVVYLDTDEDRTSGRRIQYGLGGESAYEVPVGADAVIDFGPYSWSREVLVYQPVGFQNGLAANVPVERIGNALRVVIPNSLIGEEGDGQFDLTCVFGVYGAYDFAPDGGLVKVQSPGRLSISPGDSILMAEASLDPKVRVTAVLEMDDLGSPVSQFWLVDDGFDATSIITHPANQRFGHITGALGFRGGRTFGFDYPVNALGLGQHTLTVVMISSDFVAAKQVAYQVIEHKEEN